MTPTLLSASSSAYLAMSPSASDGPVASVDGSALAGPPSEESSDDRRDDIAPSDFALLLAAMMAPAAPAPLRPRIDPTDATNPSAPSPSVGDATAAMSGALATLVALPTGAPEAANSNTLASVVDTQTTSSSALSELSTPSTPSASSSPVPPTSAASAPSAATAPSARSALSVSSSPVLPAGDKAVTAVVAGSATPPPIDPFDASGVPGTADRTAAGASTAPIAKAGNIGVDAATVQILAPSTSETEAPAPPFGLVALDRPLSLGRRVPAPSPHAVDVPIAASPPAAGLATAIGPDAAKLAEEASSTKSPALLAHDDAVGARSADPAGPSTVSPTAPLSSRSVPGSGVDAGNQAGINEAPNARSAGDNGAPKPIEADAAATEGPSAEAAPTAVARLGTGDRTAAAAASPAARSVTAAGPARISADEPSASSDEDTAPSPVGVSAQPGQPYATERPASVEGPTLAVVKAVQPGETSQQIVGAAQRAQAAGGPQQMRLEMHPGDLGAVAVEVTIEDGAVHVAMVAERGETKDLLRSSIGELRSSLVAAGFSAGRVDIQSGLSDGRFGQTADRHDPWSQSFDRPDARRDQSGAFANMFDQSSGRGDQARNVRSYSESGDRGDSVPALRGVPSTDRIVPNGATTLTEHRRDRLDLHL